MGKKNSFSSHYVDLNICHVNPKVRFKLIHSSFITTVSHNKIRTSINIRVIVSRLNQSFSSLFSDDRIKLRVWNCFVLNYFGTVTKFLDQFYLLNIVCNLYMKMLRKARDSTTK